MQAFNHLRIGVRLGIAFALVTTLMIGISIMARVGLMQIREDMNQVLHSHYAKVKIVSEIDDDVNLQARIVRNLVIMDDEAQRQGEIRTLAESRDRLAKAYESLRSRLSTARGRALFDGVQSERSGFLAEQEELLRLVRGGDLTGAKTVLLDKLRPRQLAYQRRLSELTQFQEQLMESSSESTLATVERVTALTLAAALTGVAIALASGILVTRSVTRPLAKIVSTLRTVAGGDLTVAVTLNRRDELGDLQKALSETVSGLRHLVNEVRTGIDSVTTASGQIAAGNQDLSSRTEQQASSLQETASSMEQLTATVRQSADNAGAASHLASLASDAAGRGGEMVNLVVTTMDDISASSRRVAEIVGVIDGIAFQTNILALNAAVEAARAGEQGRGFAVVAGEVRVLAKRSAEAAKEIRTLIGASADKVEAGSHQVADAGRAMQDIVEQVRKVNNLIIEIAGTAGEQSRGIEQINQAVTQMDQVTQQNAALVEESAAAAASLSHQAQQLAHAVAIFRVAGNPLDDDSARHAPTATHTTAAKPRSTGPAAITDRTTHMSKPIKETAWQSF